jgi:hypothetical protein
MKSSSVKPVPAVVAVILVAVCVFQTRTGQSSFATTSQVPPKPLLLLVRRKFVSGSHILAWVDIRNAGTEKDLENPQKLK